jgi:3-oxoacyl-[acyl-carrier protein] reductase
MGRLQGKVAFITGSSRGIGRAIAEAFGREGARVIINYVIDARAAEATVAAIKASGSDAVAIQGDTTNPSALKRMFDEADRAFGGLDIVVNNAHPGSGAGPLATISEDAIDAQLGVLKSYIIALKESANRVRDGGSIINISSGLTQLAAPLYALYSSVKAAVEQLSRSLSRELAPRAVRVNILAPGLTRTDRTAASLDSSNPTGAAPLSGPATPFNRPGEPDEVADVAVFLASDDARWVTTQVLYASGGATYAQ